MKGKNFPLEMPEIDDVIIFSRSKSVFGGVCLRGHPDGILKWDFMRMTVHSFEVVKDPSTEAVDWMSPAFHLILSRGCDGGFHDRSLICSIGPSRVLEPSVLTLASNTQANSVSTDGFNQKPWF